MTSFFGQMSRYGIPGLGWCCGECGRHFEGLTINFLLF